MQTEREERLGGQDSLAERIRRRQRAAESPPLVRSYESLSPTTHVEAPPQRGPVFERLLDHLDPVFDGRLPGNAYVWGPRGAGKSAVVTALFDRLERRSTETASTRDAPAPPTTPPLPAFTRVDARTATSEFAFYHAVLDSLLDTSVSRQGIGTDTLRSRLRDRLDDTRGTVVAVDHVDRLGEEEATPNSDATAAALRDRFTPLPDNVRWLAVGRRPPAETTVASHASSTLAVEPYEPEMLVDVLLRRTEEGLSRRAFGYGQIRRLADWADGDAHDALAALFAAVDAADSAGRSRVTETDVTAGIEAVPASTVSLARVAALPANKRRVLRRLVDLTAAERESVTTATERLCAAPDLDLSANTVERFLYELAETGVIERVQSTVDRTSGRPPSRLELRLPTTVFRRQYDERETL